MNNVADVGKRTYSLKRWTSEDDEMLAELWPLLERAEIAQQMGRSIGTLYRRARSLGLEVKPIAKSAGRRRSLHTKRPIGAERTSKDGYLERKIQDTGKGRYVDWKLVHILVWEEHNGPLPDGMIVTFKDGNKRNFDPGNLVAITRADNARRNGINRYGPEIQGSAIALGRFNAKLKRIEREMHEKCK